MCRYLLARCGGDSRKTIHNRTCLPMYTAALHGHLNVCKWLSEHGGAKDDIRWRGKSFDGDDSTLQASLHERVKGLGTAQWLILNGALCRDNDSGEIDQDIMRRDLQPYKPYYGLKWIDRRPKLLSWAQEAVMIHSNFLVFLRGTLSPTNFAGVGSKYQSTLKVFSDKPGIMELIADYAGVVRGRD